MLNYVKAECNELIVFKIYMPLDEPVKVVETSKMFINTNFVNINLAQIYYLYRW